MSSFKRVTKEQAVVLAESGVKVMETAYWASIKWSTDDPVYRSHVVANSRTFGASQLPPFAPRDPLQQRYSTLPMYTVDVE